MNVHQFKKEIVVKVLKYLNMHSDDAVRLLMGTYYQESSCGEYIVQLGEGPAKGPFQVEPATALDNFENFLKYRPALKELVMDLYIEGMSFEDNLTGNLYFNTAMARIKYYRDSKPIPSDLQGVAEYWKRVYNSENGAGTVEEFIENYHRYNN